MQQAGSVADLGTLLPVWSALPFVGMLLSIAVLPMLAPRVWHHRYPAITAAWGLLFALPFAARFGDVALHELLQVALVDYVPFLVLIATLFTIGGGIHIRGSVRGTPATNAAIMGIGSALASLVGTTGAAMVTIRPLLRANRFRRHRAHTVVFFTFLVANVGGGLTPLGDPPLFLGFLHGVPFFWTLRLWKHVLVCAAVVLVVYVLCDLWQWRREDGVARQRHAAEEEPLRIEGAINLLLLLAVVAAVGGSGLWHGKALRVLGVYETTGNALRDLVLLAILVLSWKLTPDSVRAANAFSWAPIKEVGILFAGVFVTMIPAVVMLRAGEQGALACVVRTVDSPAHFFWASGLLSSFLDNAPTYLTFLSTAVGRLFPGAPESQGIARLILEHPEFLVAISTGSVFMGANTYIGNAPNFMVKTIAEEAGVPMPSFFGYILRYSVPVLVPTFAAMTWIFY